MYDLNANGKQETKKIIEENNKTTSSFDDNPKLSLFPNINTADNGVDITEDDFYTGVQVGTWEEESEGVRRIQDSEQRRGAKKKCHYVTLSGWFPNHRDSKSCKAHSGLICIDPKNIYDVKELIAKLKKDKYVRALFLSISATSIAIVFKIDPDKHDEAFEGLRKYLRKKYKIEIDNTTDVCRPRYVSYDPDIYVNKNALLFDQYSTLTISKKAEKIEKREPDVNTTDDDFLDILKRIKEQEKDVTGDYDQWRNICIALINKFGESGRSYFHEISQFYKGYNERETDELYSYFLKWKGNGKSPTTIKTFYYHARQAGISPKMNPELEKKVVKRKAVFNQSLPSNISPEGQKLFVIYKKEHLASHPHGVFWVESDTGTVKIESELVFMVAEKMGFRSYDGEMRQIVNHLFHKKNERDLFDTLKSYVGDLDGDLQIKICSALNAFMHKYEKFLVAHLKAVTEDEIFKDTVSKCYKFYQNVYLKITAESIEQLPYETIKDKLILAELIQDREYIKYVEGNSMGKYVDYLEKAVQYNDPRKKEYIDKIIGYLAHNYKDESTPYIIVLVEMVENPKDGGGSGKNMFGSLFKITTTVHSVADSQVQLNKDFLQTWEGERIFAINDARKNFPFVFLKNLSSNGGILRKLFKNLKSLDIEKMPKFIVDTNHSFEVTDGGLKRRLIAIEFTDFFTKSGGVDVHYGCFFPRDWNLTDYVGADHLILSAIQGWLKSNRKLKSLELTETGWTKQFDQIYGEETRKFINDRWNNWIVKENCHKDGYYYISDWMFDRDYAKFCKEKRIRNPKTMQVLNSAVEDWCKNRGTQFIYKDVKNSFRIGGQQRSKRFINAVPIPVTNEIELSKT